MDGPSPHILMASPCTLLPTSHHVGMLHIHLIEWSFVVSSCGNGCFYCNHPCCWGKNLIKIQTFWLCISLVLVYDLDGQRNCCAVAWMLVFMCPSSLSQWSKMFEAVDVGTLFNGVDTTTWCRIFLPLAGHIPSKALLRWGWWSSSSPECTETPTPKPRHSTHSKIKKQRPSR